MAERRPAHSWPAFGSLEQCRFQRRHPAASIGHSAGGLTAEAAPTLVAFEPTVASGAVGGPAASGH